MNIRSLLSLILLCATTFDATLFAAKRSFDDVDYSEFYEDDEFCDDDEQEDDKDNKPKSSSLSTKKTYPCKICGKPLSNKRNRTKHERTHSEKKDYSCQFCNKTFTQSQNRDRHEKAIHLEENPHQYQCSHCKRAFTTKNNCDRHEKAIHSEKKYYSCQYCGKPFVQPSGCARHQKICTQNPSLSQANPTLPAPVAVLPPHLPNLNPDDLLYVNSLISLMQANSTQEAHPDHLPNLDADDIEDCLQGNS